MSPTEKEFAERAGVHRTYLSDIERGTRNVRLINIERVALVLGLKVSALSQFLDCDFSSILEETSFLLPRMGS